MTLLLRALWRQLLADRLATITSLLAIAIAIGAIVAVHLLSERLVAEVAQAQGSRLFGTTHWLRRPSLHEDDYFALRARWRAGELPDVTALVPVIEANVTIGVEAYRLFAFDPLAIEPSSGERGIASTTLLTADSVLAHVSTGFSSGATILLGRNALPVRVLGTFGDSGVSVPWLVADLATAEHVLGTAGALTAIGATVEAPQKRWQRILDALFPGMRRERGTRVDLAGMTFDPAADGELSRFSGSILFSLGVLSLLSALVAAFLVYQNARSHVARRELLTNRLAGLGAPDGLVKGTLLFEGSLLALMGGVAGIVVGHRGANVLLQRMANDVTTFGEATLGVWAVTKALVVAIGVGCGATVLAQTTWSRTGSRVATGVALLAGSVLLLVGVGIADSAVAGTFCAIAGASVLCIVLLARWVAFGADTLLRRRGMGLFAVLNLRQAQVSGRTVNAALAALLLAVATAIGMGEMVSSFRDAFVVSLDRRLVNDLVFDADAPIAFSATKEVMAFPGVERVTRYVETQARRADGTPVAVSATVLDVIEAGRYGFAADPAPGEVLINEQAARGGSLAVGDMLELEGASGSAAFEIVHVFRDYGAVQPRVVADLDDAQRLTGNLDVHRLGVHLAAAANATPLEDFAARRGWRTGKRDTIRSNAVATFDRTFAVSDALVWIALLVAVMGMGTAFALLELGRVRELKLLEVLGVDGRRRLAMTVTQVAVLAAHVIVLAIPLGLAIGWMLCTWLNPAGFGWSIPFSLHVEAIAVPVVCGFAAAVVAGTLPFFKRRASYDE